MPVLKVMLVRDDFLHLATCVSERIVHALSKMKSYDGRRCEGVH